jgi:hypothetical protein
MNHLPRDVLAFLDCDVELRRAEDLVIAGRLVVERLDSLRVVSCGSLPSVMTRQPSRSAGRCVRSGRAIVAPSRERGERRRGSVENGASISNAAP